MLHSKPPLSGVLEGEKSKQTLVCFRAKEEEEEEKSELNSIFKQSFLFYYTARAKYVLAAS